MSETPKIVVQSLGWNEDHAVVGDEEATAQIYVRVLVDGVAMPWINKAAVRFSGADFMEVDLSVFASSVEFQSLTKEEWAEATL